MTTGAFQCEAGSSFEVAAIDCLDLSYDGNG